MDPGEPTGLPVATDPGLQVRARGGVRRVFAAAGDGGTRRRGRLSGLCAWTETLQLVKVGGKSRLVCAADLAYGNQRWPPLIKPGATLVFEIKEWVCPVNRESPATASRPGRRASIPTPAEIPGRVRLIAMEAGHGASQAA